MNESEIEVRISALEERVSALEGIKFEEIESKNILGDK